MSEILWFADEAGTDLSRVGGKGANLGRLTQAGFPVPPGFVVDANAYLAFLRDTGLTAKIGVQLSGVNYDDPETLENCCETIRELVVSADLPPALASQIVSAYGRIGEDTYVAVRSSGTAEDLEGASFAGLHDTYLDIRGGDGVLDAVKRCWASLWATRAVSYRNTKGFDHFTSPIAVVVQTMVESEVSGVMFTGNPMTTATDEIVINASWGLGEAVVQGITTPDEFTVRHTDLSIARRILGDKEVRIVRNPDTGVGIVTQDTPTADRTRYCLTDEQVAELADLGRRVQTAYGEFPQDTEWALHGGQFYLLQARPVTGVEFSWDAEVNASVKGKLEDGSETWSRAWPDEVWTGGVTPLQFSWRVTCMNMMQDHGMELWGLPELTTEYIRTYKFHKGGIYYNANIDKQILAKTVPPAFKAYSLFKLPKTWHDDAMAAPFSWATYAKMYLRIQALEPQNGFRFHKTLQQDYIDKRIPEFDGLSDDELRKLSDTAIKTYIDHMIDIEGRYYDVLFTGLTFYMREAMALMTAMIQKWYDGDNPGVLTDLMTGNREWSTTSAENQGLWELADQIRQSPELLAAFETHTDGDFLREAATCAGGTKFLADYDAYMAHNGHRGHSDRDIYFTRRAEDPGVTYRSLQALLGSPPAAEMKAREEQVAARREGAAAEVIESLRRSPLGGLKAELFKLLFTTVHKWLAARDNERHFCDRSTFAIKRAFLEVSRRCRERGRLGSDRDCYFLTMGELYDVLHNRDNQALTAAKIEGRMRDFDRFDNKEYVPAPYMVNGQEVDLDQEVTEDEEGVLRGAGTSRGTVTGRARVVKSLKEINIVQPGDIMITNSTDPGWTPVFLVIKGIVLETGGVLAHGALLAREYGFPAVQVRGALRLIPDGATITINGDTGVVTIDDLGDNAPADTPAELVTV